MRRILTVAVCVLFVCLAAVDFAKAQSGLIQYFELERGLDSLWIYYDSVGVQQADSIHTRVLTADSADIGTIHGTIDTALVALFADSAAVAGHADEADTVLCDDFQALNVDSLLVRALTADGGTVTDSIWLRSHIVGGRSGGIAAVDIGSGYIDSSMGGARWFPVFQNNIRTMVTKTAIFTDLWGLASHIKGESGKGMDVDTTRVQVVGVPLLVRSAVKSTDSSYVSQTGTRTTWTADPGLTSFRFSEYDSVMSDLFVGPLRGTADSAAVTAYADSATNCYHASNADSAGDAASADIVVVAVQATDSSWIDDDLTLSGTLLMTGSRTSVYGVQSMGTPTGLGSSYLNNRHVWYPAAANAWNTNPTDITNLIPKSCIIRTIRIYGSLADTGDSCYAYIGRCAYGDGNAPDTREASAKTAGAVAYYGLIATITQDATITAGDSLTLLYPCLYAGGTATHSRVSAILINYDTATLR